VGGVPRVETHLEWQMTPHTYPSWEIKGRYITQIKGDPCIYNKHMIFPKPGVDLSNPDNFVSIGMTVTGLPALNAISAVVAAPPGLLTSADLPLCGFAGRSSPNSSIHRTIAIERGRSLALMAFRGIAPEVELGRGGGRTRPWRSTGCRRLPALGRRGRVAAPRSSERAMADRGGALR
jgi:hypothetical protein